MASSRHVGINRDPRHLAPASFHVHCASVVSMLEIPAELSDSIVDHLKSDISALTTCSLLSRQWLPRSRYYIFSSVSFCIGRHESRPRNGQQRVDEFLSILDSPLATFILYVKEVKLTHHLDGLVRPPIEILTGLRNRGIRSTHTYLWNVQTGSLIMPPAEILFSLHARGIQPTRIYLDCQRHFFTLPPDGPTVFASSLVHLDLELRRNCFSLGIIVDYISAFPLLESLKLTGPPTYIDLTPPKSLALPPRLHTLHTDQAVITDWILSFDPIPVHVTTLCFTSCAYRPSDHWLGVNRYMRSVAGKSIQSLTLGECHPPRAAANWIGPDFRNLRRLQHLAIHVSRDSSFEHLVVVLSAVKCSPSCRTLDTLTLILPLRVDYNVETLIALDAELADTDRYERLHRLKISALDANPEVHEEGSEQPLAIALRTYLPRCEQRGILHVDIPGLSP
ncbi:hypothetical protein DFH06DRAFT_1336421 [Mycena polygramma]|nr:hypothetical protein DFH06DRAFT_1336421 [Mycena polygramma]